MMLVQMPNKTKILKPINYFYAWNFHFKLYQVKSKYNKRYFGALGSHAPFQCLISNIVVSFIQVNISNSINKKLLKLTVKVRDWFCQLLY